MNTDKELPTVLVVDDAPANLSVLAGLLDRDYRVKLASSGAKALELVQRTPPDVILLDVMMPDMDGYEVCRRLKADPVSTHIPVLFLTAMSQLEDEAKGFEVGGADFIHKPIHPPIVHARVRTHLQIKAYQDELTDRNQWLEVELGQRMAQVDQLRDATVHVMISFAEFRDEDTGNHVKRTQEYVRTLATWLHAQGLHLDADFLKSAMEIARSHHEKWDGSGYPEGLAGEQIPLAARLMAVADVYDALISARPYKKPMSHEMAVSFIHEGSGKHFDPAIVRAMDATLPQFVKIAQTWSDE